LSLCITSQQINQLLQEYLLIYVVIMYYFPTNQSTLAGIFAHLSL